MAKLAKPVWVPQWPVMNVVIKVSNHSPSDPGLRDVQGTGSPLEAAIDCDILPEVTYPPILPCILTLAGANLGPSGLPSP